MQNLHGGIAQMGMDIDLLHPYLLHIDVASQHRLQAPPPGLRAFGSYVSKT